MNTKLIRSLSIATLLSGAAFAQAAIPTAGYYSASTPRSESTVTIAQLDMNASKYKLEVNIVTSLGSTCEFISENATVVFESEIAAQLGDCQVNAYVVGKDQIGISSSGDCSQYCGANVSLNIPVLHKVRAE